jgi:hypothetical protein
LRCALERRHDTTAPSASFTKTHKEHQEHEGNKLHPLPGRAVDTWPGAFVRRVLAASYVGAEGAVVSSFQREAHRESVRQ